MICYPTGRPDAFYTIPNSVTIIRANAFELCSNLKTITIPDSVTSIETEAFRDCSNLKYINIPKSATDIKPFAFIGCSSLKEIHNNSIIPQEITSDCFSEVDMEACISYVPKGSYDAYKNAEGWKECINIIEE